MLLKVQQSRLAAAKRELEEETGIIADEFLNIVEVDLEELVQDIMNGKITDGKTQVAILKVCHMKNK